MWITEGGYGTNADVIYQKDFAAGRVEIPGHGGKLSSGTYGVPHLAVVSGKN